MGLFSALFGSLDDHDDHRPEPDWGHRDLYRNTHDAEPAATVRDRLGGWSTGRAPGASRDYNPRTDPDQLHPERNWRN